jgi:hypothetical protein
VTVCAAVILAAVAYRGWHAGGELGERAAALAERLPELSGKADDAEAEPEPDELGTAAADRIRGRYLFAPAPPQAFRSPLGVLGDRVLYPGGQSFGVGDNALGATVKAVGPHEVEVEYEGETITLPVSSGGGNRPGRSGRRSRR